MPLDLNNAPEQRADGIIPDGTFAKVKITMKPGGVTLANMDPIDNGLFRASNSSEVVMLECEFIVVHGPHSRRKFPAYGNGQFFTVAGGQVDEKGVSKGWNITFGLLKAMLESNLGLHPKDDSPKAQMSRRMNGIYDLNEKEFVAKIGVEVGSDAPGGGRYPDRNKLVHVVTPDEPEYQIVMGGGEAHAKPSGGTGSQSTASRAAPVQHEQKAAWQAQAAPAAAPPAAVAPAASGWAPGANQTPTVPTPQPRLPLGAQQPPAPAAPSGPPWLNG